MISKLIVTLLTAFASLTGASQCTLTQNNCVTFTVGQGTGCDWMCNYCANSLGTYNYFFTTPVCSYQDSGCVGNPQVGVAYTCCSL